jgi:muramoyltetrapeptide carboxypeptidase
MKRPLKPPALRKGDSVCIVSPASASEAARLERGCQELVRLGYRPVHTSSRVEPLGYFAGSSADRSAQLLEGMQREDARAVICSRGGYGSNYLLDALDKRLADRPRILVGYSDITTLQIFLWQKLGWVTFYGPMAAAGLDAGAGAPGGYDAESFTRAVSETKGGWTINLLGEPLASGEAEGVLLGGCMTLVEATLATPWELELQGAIVILEDRAMKPYQVDRALMHLKQSGKLKNVRGIILGEFPESAPPAAGSPSVAEVCRRVLGDMKIPVVWGGPFGHTQRPTLTLPLGVRARLRTAAQGQLEILEPAVSP